MTLLTLYEAKPQESAQPSILRCQSSILREVTTNLRNLIDTLYWNFLHDTGTDMSVFHS